MKLRQDFRHDLSMVNDNAWRSWLILTAPFDYQYTWKTENTNHIGKFVLARAEQNWVIRATGHYHVLAIPHETTSRSVSVDNCISWSTLYLYYSWTSSPLRFMTTSSRSFSHIRGLHLSESSELDLIRRASGERHPQLMISSFLVNRRTPFHFNSMTE
jgi:hypothetical protein